MKRRTLDLLFSSGALALAGLLLVLGLVMTSNANFAKNYVKDQLTAQNIQFTPLSALTDEEKRSACVVEYAGQQLTTGKQAECYANDYIGLHLKEIADGQTYADLGTPQRELDTQVEAAEAANDPALPSLQEDLAAITGQRDSLFKGEALRGVLLTSYGFSVFGVKGGDVATVAYIAAALLALLAIAGFVHAFRTPKDEAFAAPERGNGKVDVVDKERVSV
jgi:Ca2+-binding RTX toxin-like protein